MTPAPEHSIPIAAQPSSLPQGSPAQPPRKQVVTLSILAHITTWVPAVVFGIIPSVLTFIEDEQAGLLFLVFVPLTVLVLYVGLSIHRSLRSKLSTDDVAGFRKRAILFIVVGIGFNVWLSLSWLQNS